MIFWIIATLAISQNPYKETLVGREPPFSRNRAFALRLLLRLEFGSHKLFGCGNRARFCTGPEATSLGDQQCRLLIFGVDLDPNFSCPIVFSYSRRATERSGWACIHIMH
jgi:hypothetical protein